jgi:hypothetical protein
MRIVSIPAQKLATTDTWLATAREIECPPSQPMAVAHIAPPARSVTPAMKITVSALVRIQFLRIAASIVGLGGWPANN